MKPWIKNTIRGAIHLPHGAGVGYFGMLAVMIDWRYCFLCLAWLILCCGYQVIEDWRIHDRSYLDWRGYMVGFWIGIIIARWVL